MHDDPSGKNRTIFDLSNNKVCKGIDIRVEILTGVFRIVLVPRSPS